MGLSMEDTLAIQALYARYNHAVDFGDAEAWADCFTSDAVFEAQPVGPLTGREALVDFAHWYRDTIKGRHWTNNLLLEAMPGGARGTCYLILFRLGVDPVAPMLTGIYRDEMVEEADGWKFKSRTMTSDA